MIMAFPPHDDLAHVAHSISGCCLTLEWDLKRPYTDRVAMAVELRCYCEKLAMLTAQQLARVLLMENW